MNTVSTDRRNSGSHDNDRKIAELLLRSGAVTLNIRNPYRYASGILSPIYCDNRVLLSFPEARRQIVAAFGDQICSLPDKPQLIAGVATAGIAWSAWIAEFCDLPLVYVRANSKKHGKGNTIEGAPPRGARTVVIEDLLSTGGSSSAAVNALRAAGLDVGVCLAIFSYQLPAADATFENLDCAAIPLTNFDALLEVAACQGILSPTDLDISRQWNSNPQAWGARFATGEKPCN